MMSTLVALAFGAAVVAQLLLAAWIARIYATIPAKIPYGTAGNVYFWYGPKAIVWSAPAAFLAILACSGAVIVQAPPQVGAQPLIAISFAALAAVTPVLAIAIQQKINAARRREGL